MFWVTAHYQTCAGQGRAPGQRWAFPFCFSTLAEHKLSILIEFPLQRLTPSCCT